MSASLHAAAALWRYRLLFGLACLVMTVIAASQLATLQVSNSLDMWYPQDDQALLQYQQFQQRFGSDEIVVIAVTASSSASGFESDEGMQRVAELTDSVYYVQGVASVTSISTVPGTMPQARHRLLSHDRRTTALLVQMSGGADLERRRHVILAELATAVSDYGLTAKYAGYGVIYESLNQASTEDSALLLIAAHLVMLALLVAVMRRIGPAAVTLLAVGMAATWTMGLYAALGQQINMVTMALPTLVLVIGVADCVHLLRSVARQPMHLDRPVRITRGIAAVIGPCTLTSLTTAFGFLALTLSDLPVVQSLGLFGAIGMLAALLASLVVVTACLTFTQAEIISRDTRLDRVASGTARVAQASPIAVIAGFALLAVAAAGGIARLQTDTFSIAYLPDTHTTRLDSEFIEAQIGPYAPIDYIIRADNVLDPEILGGVHAWQQAAGQIDGIGWSWSLFDALDIDPEVQASGLTAEFIAGQTARIRYLSPAMANAMISGQTELRVTFGAPMMSARSVQLLLREIESKADFPQHVEIEAAGYANLYTRIVERLVSSQIQGFALALGLILLAISLTTRSVGRVLLAIPANVFPIAATLGLMGWCGIPLDVATATIATVIIGLIVDDTVHILRPAENRRDGLASVTQQAIARSGGSLIMTSLILSGGFLVMGLADIRTMAWFGLLSSFAIGAAIFTDLLLLPALATLSDRIRRPVSLPQGA